MIEAKNVSKNLAHLTGTSGQGKIIASYDTLVSVFGQPEPGDQCTTDAEWIILFTDADNEETVIATIYNYKNGKAYRGGTGPSIENISAWSIGGHTKRAFELVEQFIKGI